MGADLEIYKMLIDRLYDFFADDGFSWNENETISLKDIDDAIKSEQNEEKIPYGDAWQCLCNRQTKSWHIGRVVYFINHPNEIQNINIDNLIIDDYIFPVPIIIDGNHRLMAAVWLNHRNKMKTINCIYGGRLDLLDYLTGKVDECPSE